MKKWIVTITTVLVAVCGARATTVVLAPDADGDIRSGAVDTSYNRTVLPVTNLGATDNHIKPYIRFQLPSDIGTVSNAALKLTFAVSRPSGKTYRFYALNDGVAYETTWLEWNSGNTGDADTGLTWNNAPANDPTSGTNFTSDATFLGTLFKGSDDPSMTFDTASLVSALNADNNGFITIMLSVENITNSGDQIASKEHASVLAAQLTLEYAPLEGVIEEDLMPDADADIRSSGLATNAYNRDVLLISHVGSDSSAVTNAKAYIRFKLPAGFERATSAVLEMPRASAGAWNWTYTVHGLNDGIDNEADWIESNANGITWNTAPGNDTGSPNGFLDSTVLGTFTTLGANNGGTNGDNYAVSSGDMIEFLNADTNGYVTFMIGRVLASTSYDQFASQSNTNYPGPKLVLSYVSSLSYPSWIENYPGVGSETGMADDPDNDSLNNLGEWALGGNPDDPSDQGLPVVTETVEDGGTNWLEYTYPKRKHADNLGLTYWLEQQSAKLTPPSWTNDNYEVVGTGILNDEFNTVTNRIPTDAEAIQFLRLRIEAD